jgi:CTP:molybdopterin cytidylyltransferase MocA
VPERRIGALVLAAGAGRRFGGAKQLARLDGRPLLEHALRAAAALSPRVAVLGHAAEEVRAGVDLHGAEPVVCDDWAEGQAASLRRGVAALGDVDAAVVLLADMPGVTAAAVGAVVAAWDGTAEAVRASYDGAPGHPVLLARPLLARVGELRGDTGFRALLAGADVTNAEVGHLADPRDVDTRASLEAWPTVATPESAGPTSHR